VSTSRTLAIPVIAGSSRTVMRVTPGDE